VGEPIGAWYNHLRLSGNVGQQVMVDSDAVNTASRMESHGAGGCVQITRSTYELIQNEFVCEAHGQVSVKGEDEMDVWHVLQRKPQIQAVQQT